MVSSEEKDEWGEFPEFEVSELRELAEPADSEIRHHPSGVLETIAGEQAGKGAAGCCAEKVRLRQLMDSTVDVLLHHFDDELAQVGQVFLQAEYCGTSKEKRDCISSHFSGGVMDDLEAALAKEQGFVAGVFRAVHQPYWNDHHETHKEAYPFFDFSVDIPMSDACFGQGGCRLVVTASSYVDIGQDTLDRVFRYARQYVALQSIVQSALSLYHVPAPRGSILEGLLNLAAPHNLTDEKKHVTPPCQELGAVSYELSVGLTVLPGKVMVEFRDTSGLVSKAADAHSAVADHAEDSSGAAQQDFQVIRNGLDTSSRHKEEHRYVTVLVREY